MKNFFNLFLIALVGAFLVGCGDSKSSGQPKKDDTQVDDAAKNPEAPAAVKTPYELFLADFWGTGKELQIALANALGAPTNAGGIAVPQYPGGPIAFAVGNPASGLAANTVLYFSSATAAATEVASLKISGYRYADIDTGNLGGQLAVFADVAAVAAVGPAANSTLTAAQLKTAGIVLSQSAADSSITLTLSKKVAVGTNAANGANPGNVDGPVSPLNAAVRKFEVRIKTYTPSTRSGTADVLARVSNNDSEAFVSPIVFNGGVNFSIAP